MRRFPLLLALLCAGLGAEETDVTLVATSRGGKIEVLLDRPANANGAAVVLAPGRGYSMRKPLLEECARRLAAAGFLSVRFDWAYTTSKGAPSEEFRDEFEDMDAAIAFAGRQPGIGKVLLAGKSMGSVLGLVRAATRSDDLAGVALLTFPAEAGGPADRLPALKIPAIIITGDADPGCPLPPLYAVAARCGTPLSIVIVPGDHGFRQGDDAAKERENIAFAADALVLWAKRR